MEIKAVILPYSAQQQLAVVMALHLAKDLEVMAALVVAVVLVTLLVVLVLLVKVMPAERLIIRIHKLPVAEVVQEQLVKMLLVAQVVMVVLELHLQLQVLQ
jgi:hypothetical protein